MIKKSLKTPVVFIVFNRPDTTLKVFEQIRRIKPEKLFVIADGPRLNKSGEIQKCKETRDIIDNVDWPCELFKNYSDFNLGCGKRVSTGIDWVFEFVEKAIIIEDDCLPNLDFFNYCEELLDKFEYNHNIFSICGSNFLKGNIINQSSYYFSSHFHVWGWATWKRAWKFFDYESINLSFDIVNEKLKQKFLTKSETRFYKKMFSEMKDKQIDTWDYQWFFTHIYYDGLTIIPNKNLVSNIGSEGTHFSQNNYNPRINLPLFPILPIVHPKQITLDKNADHLLYILNFKNTKVNIIKQKLYKIKILIGNLFS
jgi:hypothetical protein